MLTVDSTVSKSTYHMTLRPPTLDRRVQFGGIGFEIQGHRCSVVFLVLTCCEGCLLLGSLRVLDHHALDHLKVLEICLGQGIVLRGRLHHGIIACLGSTVALIPSRLLCFVCLARCFLCGVVIRFCCLVRIVGLVKS